MRVIAGSAKGRRLRAPAGARTRPMMDRVKEALFSSIAFEIPGAEVLDLYAGSGAIGIEALSRGALSATFVEKDRAALATINHNLITLGLVGEVVAGEVDEFLANNADSFSVIFIDPPYRLSLALVNQVLARASARLANGGLMVLHRRAGEDGPEAPAGTHHLDARRYGGTQLWLYRKDES